MGQVKNLVIEVQEATWDLLESGFTKESDIDAIIVEVQQRVGRKEMVDDIVKMTFAEYMK